VLSALYYPHSTIRDEALVKQALLLWDKIDVITPSEDYRLEGDNEASTRALKLIANPRPPTQQEKRAAHGRILALANEELPKWFAFDLSKEHLQYSVYPQKFLPDTWEELKASNLARQSSGPNEFEDYVLCRWFGLTMMSILAEECAGSQLRLLTDEEDSYSALGRFLTKEYAGTYSNVASFDGDRLVSTSIKAIGADDIPLDTLIDLRQREGSFLRELRHKYLREVDNVVTALSTAKTASDKVEIERKFEQAMADDYARLTESLKLKAMSAIFSKEMLVAFLAAAGAVVEPWTSSVVGIGALIKANSDYRISREETMRKHATSWLFRSRGGSLTTF
jgi:hypothetical protein